MSLEKYFLIPLPSIRILVSITVIKIQIKSTIYSYSKAQ
jgi:hypothetical protein